MMKNLIDLNYGMEYKSSETKEAEDYRKRLSAVSAMVELDIEKNKSYEDKFLDLCNDKNIEELKKMYEGYSIISKMKSIYLLRKKTILDKIYKKSTMEAQLEVFKWLKSIGYEYELNSITFYRVIEKGNYEMAIYLYSEDKEILSKENKFKKSPSKEFMYDMTHNIYELGAIMNMEKKQDYEFMKFFSEISNYELYKEGNIYKFKIRGT